MTDARLLVSRYEVGPVLGYGGMAEVHRGRDTRLGRDVAIKVLRTDLARDPGFQARFRREAQNAASLNHPAIVSIYDTGEDETVAGTLPFIIMEYVEGRTLKEVQATEGPLMPQRALEITADVCAALDFSHRHGIVHRDIKPANVMLTPNGAVKVMDFGIARAIASATSSMTQTSAVIGTAQYLSPEQARGETVDARSDVYSTGCLLYELLVGHPPFTGDNPVSVAYQHVREDPVPPSELNPDVTPEMDAIVLKAMAKNPANRYQSAGEMRDDLLRAAAGHPVAATPVLTAAERTAVIAGGGAGSNTGGYPTQPVPPEPRGRKGVTYALIALAVLTVFALAAFGTSYLLRNNQPQVTVPNVVGEQVATAKDTLQKRGFVVTTKDVPSNADQVNKVIRQNPNADEKAEKGSTVQLDVGRGPDQVTVPNQLVGADQAGAEFALQQAGLVPDVQQVDGSQKAGQVLKASPASGTLVAKGSKVVLQVSKGNLKLVPQVVGLSRADAQDKLQNAGLKSSVRFQTQPDAAPGTVINQDPDQNSQVPANTVVTIVVAQRPTPSPTTGSPSPTPTESPSPSDSPSATPSTTPPTVPQLPGSAG